MIRFEIKKALSKTSSKVALVILALLLALWCYFAAGVEYTDERGNSQKGYSYAQKLRAMKKEWAGVLDEEMLRKVINENRRIKSSPEYLSDDIQQRNIAYSWGQGISNIRGMLNESFRGFGTYNYYLADSLTPDQASMFYENRTRSLKEWLATKDDYSQAKKDFLIDRYEALKTPFKIDSIMGWENLFEWGQGIIMLVSLILGYLLAGIFAMEFQYKTDAIFFSSYNGRNSAVVAKIAAGLIVATIVYWVTILLFSVFTLAYLGFDGALCPVQTSWKNWRCFYNINNLQAFLIVSVGGYIGCLFISAMTMYISAKTKSAVVAATVPFVLIFVRSFVPENNMFMYFFPDRPLLLSNTLHQFDMVEIGGKVFGGIPVLLAVYTLLSLVLLPIIYQTYRKKQLR